MIEIELAWAAGFFDGEGCTTLVRNKKVIHDIHPRISINQNHPEVLERFKIAVGAGIIYGPYLTISKSKPYWVFHINKRKECYRVLQSLFPYLSSLKREQATKILQEYEDRNNG